MATLAPDQIIPNGVARRLLAERGHASYVGLVTDAFRLEVVTASYPENCRDQHAWNAESRALDRWLTMMQLSGKSIDFDGIPLNFDVVPWSYNRHGEIEA